MCCFLHRVELVCFGKMSGLEFGVVRCVREGDYFVDVFDVCGVVKCVFEVEFEVCVGY